MSDQPQLSLRDQNQIKLAKDRLAKAPDAFLATLYRENWDAFWLGTMESQPPITEAMKVQGAQKLLGLLATAG